MPKQIIVTAMPVDGVTSEIAEDGTNTGVRRKQTILQRFFLKTDIHGLPEIYEARSSTTRTLWTGLVVFALCLLTVELFLSIQQFINNPILTTYTLVSEPNGMPFPEIYICPANPISRTQHEHLNVDSEWESEHVYGLLSAAGNMTGLDSILGAHLSLAEALASSREENFAQPVSFETSCTGCEPTEPPPIYFPQSIQEYFLKVGYGDEDLIREMSFRSLPLNVNDSVHPVFDAGYGKCFLLRTDGKQQTVAGVGMKLVIDLDIAGSYPKEVERQPLFDGVTIRLAYPQFDPTAIDGIQLAPATYNHLTIHGKRLEMLKLTKLMQLTGKPISCRSDDETENYRVLNLSYTQSACLHDCAQRVVVDECSCLLPIDRSFVNDNILHPRNTTNASIDVCSTSEFHRCASPALNRSKHAGELTDCSAGCLPACNQWQFSFEHSAIPFPSELIRRSAADIFTVPVSSYGLVFSAGEPKPPPMPPASSICAYPAVVGCHPNDSTIADRREEYWRWDSEIGDCLNLTYYTCDSVNRPPLNLNKFQTKRQCLDNCGYGNQCLGKSPSSKAKEKRAGCDAKTQRYYYDRKSGRCLRYYWNGCDRTNNQFVTREQCNHICGGLANDKCSKNSVTICAEGRAYVYMAPTDNTSALIVDVDNTSGDCVDFELFSDSCMPKMEQNRFKDYETCAETCIEMHPNKPPFCTSEQYDEFALCAPVEHFAYNIVTGECETFLHYDGTCAHKNMSLNNNFNTISECLKCVTPIEKPNTTEHRQLPPDVNRASPPPIISGWATVDKLKQGDIIVIDIAYSSLQYIKVTQEESITFTTLVGNIGGQLGLWLGASIVTVVKIVFLTCPFLVPRRRNRHSVPITD